MDKEKGTKRDLNTKDEIKVVTDNKLITAVGLSKLSLKARKLLYLIMAQCRQTDEEFYIYEIKPTALSEKLGVDRSHVYALADELTGELMDRHIAVKQPDAKRFKKYAMFSMCEYDDDHILRFKLNPDMTDFLLGLKKSFTQTVLADYLKMRSVYSMAIWHLMQREMNGRKPGTDRVSFYLSLEELRIVTGTENKFKQMSQFKQFVLGKAIQDIKKCCGLEVTYEHQRKGKAITGFFFTVRGPLDLTAYQPSKEAMERIRQHDLTVKMREGSITPKEFDELQELMLKYNQMSFVDYFKNQGLEWDPNE